MKYLVEEVNVKNQTGKMLIQDMNLKAGERFKVGRHVMVYVGSDGGKWDTIVSLKVWKKRNISTLFPNLLFRP